MCLLTCSAMCTPRGVLSLLLPAPCSVATAVLSVRNVRVAVVDSDGTAALSNTGDYPAKLLSNPQVPPSQSIEVSTRSPFGGRSTATWHVHVACPCGLRPLRSAFRFTALT